MAGDLDVEFTIAQQAGLDGIVDRLKHEWNVPGRQALGMVVDADANLAGQWQIVSHWVNTYPVMRDLPTEPEVGGTVISGVPRLGIWVMPDNRSTGELEDFIFGMIPQPDPIWPRAERYIDEIPENDRKFPSHKALRAKVHAWMATRSRPRSMWSGISESDLQLEENSRTFLDWLRRLFGDNP